MANEELAGTAGEPAPPIHIQDFIFTRELAEVYLLIDNVSTAESKNFPTIAADDPVFGSPDRKSWLQQVCEIGWPPAGSAVEQALQATKLIRARDMLNQAAAPATGATIAFTLLVSGEDGPRHLSQQRRAGWWREWIPGWFGGDADHEAEAARRKEISRAGWKQEPPSRRSLASLAFPSLPQQARRFKFWLGAIITLLVVWLVLTCLLSWDVATGNSLLQQWKLSGDTRTDVLAQIAKAEDQAGQTGASANTDGQAKSASTSSGSAHLFCPDPHRTRNAHQPTASTDAIPPGLTELRLCAARRDAERQYRLASNNLEHWMTRKSLLPPYDVPRPLPDTDADGGIAVNAPVNIQWAAVELTVLGGAVLPIFYGVLGAGAAVVRSISAKMRDSLLSPRDLRLSLVQLVLGAIIGGCVGLFITPTTDPSQSAGGLLGSVHLSASALCFVAGFGVDGVFVALESLIARVFNMPDPTKK